MELSHSVFYCVAMVPVDSEGIVVSVMNSHLLALHVHE